ncbi:hypothetical protein ATANTOWER_023086 [Ataeniobius toweri]|uniref:Uncharacterized protein n=1 Tax=Ataeniobius toweri TaxID=208326 RepID=A0ABU7AZ76_9TELE|nr:hypothetical protein [Ataeniobius toweri]
MVNTSVNSLLPKDRSGSTRSNSRLAPCFTCSACPPSNIAHHLEESTHTARLPANASVACSSLPGLTTFTHNEPFPEANQLWSPDVGQKHHFSINLFKPLRFLLRAALESLVLLSLCQN